MVGFAPDLMDQSRLRNAGVSMAGSLQELVGTAADLVVIDLSRAGALEAIASIDAPVIGFGPHVDTAALEAARTAGCRLVLPRSQFFRRLPELLHAP